MRTISTTERFDQSMNNMRGEYPRIGFVVDNIKPLIQAKPEAYPCVIGQPLSGFKLVAFEGVPDATIYFRYDDLEVVLIRIDLNSI